jgi:predicted transcriptional regulator
MTVAKEEVRNLLNNLPDDCALEDAQYHLYVLENIKRGLSDVEAGRIYTQEEVEAHIVQKWRS